MELLIKSSLDQTLQPSLFYEASKGGRPLFTVLHTWSYDRFSQVDRMLPVAKKYDFNLLIPEFRGPNKKHNPQCFNACASELAKRDVKDAIDYVVANKDVDSDNIFLYGASGGGHMALMMAAYCPEVFRAVSAVVPISNLKQWHDDNANYRDDVSACCGGDTEEMMKRSPITHTGAIAKANLKIFHGKYDPCISVEQSIALYNRIMSESPDSRVFLDIFDGGHETDMEAVMHWIMSQFYEKELSEVMG